MKKIKTTMTMLLIVFGLVATANNFDSVSLSNYCQIIKMNKNHFRLIYKANTNQQIQINIYDEQSELVYKKSESGNSLNKLYDFSHLGKGSYTVKLKTSGYVFHEIIEVKDMEFECDFKLLKLSSKKVSLIGWQKDSTNTEVYILDQHRNALHKDPLNRSKIRKSYNLEKVEGGSVYFLLYKQGSLIREEKIEF